MKPDKYLPIGSIVLLKDAKKRMMITGFAIKTKDSGNDVFDYMGCLYPEGILSLNKVLLFNHDQIDKIFYIGFTDYEWHNLEPKIDKIVNTIYK